MSRVLSRSLLRFGVITAAVVLAVAGLARSGAVGATGDQETYLQFNLCGNVCNGGGLAVITELRTAIVQRHPYAVTLNEVCENQFARLAAELTGYGGRFDPTGPTCRNGARYGNAALLRSNDVSLVGSWALPNRAGREPRRLMCLGGQPTGRIVCVTHISTQPVDISAQIRTVANVLNGLSSGHASVVLGGDFNTDPADARMNPLVRNRLVGTDVVNEETFGRHRYDYVFLSSGGWSSIAAGVTEAPDGLSDHKALWATTSGTRDTQRPM